MKSIWIIDPYCGVPSPGWREGRFVLIARALSEAGYDVHLFMSNFSHKNKTFTYDQPQIRLSPNFNIILVQTPGYSRHISFKRITYEQTFAKSVAENALGIPLPSIVILKEPAIFMFGYLKSFIQDAGAKIILDVIDLWPETFELIIPKPIRWIGKLVFSPLYSIRRKIFLSASAVTAVAPDYLDLVLDHNKSIPGKVIYWGCNVSLIQNELKSAEGDLLQTLNLPQKDSQIWGIYAGTLGEGYDIVTVLKTAKKMEKTAPQLKFLIAGTGPLLEEVKTAANESPNIIYLGSLPTTILYQLFRYCDFGFSTYADGSMVSMPIKCYDYFAAGLPLVNSLGRNLQKVISTYNLGFQYKAANVNSLVNALALLLKADLKEMKLRCQQISHEFNNEVQYSKIVEVVKTVDC